MDGWIDRYIDGWMDGWMDGWIDRYIDGWMDRHIDRQTGIYRQIRIKMLIRYWILV